MGCVELQHQTVDPFVLEAPMGTVLRREGEMNTENGEQKEHSLDKRGSFHLRFEERKMLSP